MTVLALILSQIRDGAEQVFGLGQNRVFKNRLIGHEGVHGSHPLDGCVQIVEKLVSDPGRDFRSVSPAQHVFVSHNHSSGLLYRSGNRLPVIRA